MTQSEPPLDGGKRDPLYPCRRPHTLHGPGESTGLRGPVHPGCTPLFLAHPRGLAQIAPSLFPDTCRRHVYPKLRTGSLWGGRELGCDDWVSTPTCQAAQDDEWSQWAGGAGYILAPGSPHAVRSWHRRQESQNSKFVPGLPGCYECT